MTLRRLCFTVLGLALLAGVASAQGPDLNILHFNDVYEIEPVQGGTLGGAARVATLVNERADSNPMILFSGDLFSPSIMSTVFQGAQMVDVFNQLGTDYAVFGNHEFDFGPEVAMTRLDESSFPWLSTNLLEVGTSQAFAGGTLTELVNWDGLNVGIIGLVEDWRNLTSAGENADYVDYVAAGRDAAQALKAQGADIVIALTHMEMRHDRVLAEQVPEIDLILGGHDHEPMHEVVNNTLIWKTGSDFKTLGQLKVYYLAGQKALVLPQYIAVTTRIAEDPAMAAVVADYAAVLDEELGQTIGQAEVSLNALRGSVRTEETNFGNLIADASRAFTGADVSLMNGGGIRSDTEYGPGDLTRKDIFSVLPFGNVVITIELSGADLLAAFENSVSSVENVSGRFAQLSGATLLYDPAAPAGSRIISATVGGQALDPDATYIVAVNDFIGSGGDGYEMFTDAPRLLNEAGGPLLAEVVINYVTEQGAVAPALEGRIQAQ